MQKFLKTAAAVLTVLMLISLLAGCTPIEQPETGEGGTLNLYGIDPHTLDPALSGDATSHEYIMQIFGGLLRLDDNMEPSPDIAREWKVSSDGKTYTFYLRDDVTFHDGRKVKAEDFKYSWERACSPSTGSGTAATYLGDIVGVGEVLSGASSEISGVRVPNDLTLEVTIDAPKSFFLSKLTYPTTYVVDRNNVKSGGNWWHNPNGTGPFKLDTWEEASRLVLVKNPDYYGEKARLDSVEFHLWAGIPINLYETGEIDIASVSVNYIDKVTDTAGDFYDEMVSSPQLSFNYIAFNAEKPPFDDVNIRRAFSMAVDKDKLVSLLFREMVQKADGILPPGMPGFNGNLSGLEFDAEEALRLIKESSYGSVDNLPPITITTMGWGGAISGDMEAVIHQWKQNLGIQVEVRQLEPDRFLYHLKDEKDDLYEMGWIADYPHPQDFLEVLFRGDAEYNYGGYASAEVNSLLEKAGLEMDGEKSLEMYREAEQILVDEAACLPLYFGQNYTLIKPYVKGYRLNPLGIAALNRVYIEPH